MDKYEFNIKVEQIKKLVNKNDFATAMKIADTIDWRRVRNANLLSMISQVYEKNREYQEAKEVLLLAYERAPIGKRLLYKLTELALREGSISEAEDYYREFCDLAPEDSRQHILRYLILKEKKAPIDQLIRALERYTAAELDEKWLYELADLYARAGRSAECVQLCDKMILLFGVGTYVERAMDLKQRYAPLNHYQRNLAENKEVYEERLRAVEQEYENGILGGMQGYVSPTNFGGGMEQSQDVPTADGAYHAEGVYQPGGTYQPQAAYGVNGAYGTQGNYETEGTYGTGQNYGTGGAYGAEGNYGAGGAYGAEGNYGAGGAYETEGNYGAGGAYGTEGNYGAGGSYGTEGDYGAGGSYGAERDYEAGGVYGTEANYGAEGTYGIRGNYQTERNYGAGEVYGTEGNYGAGEAYGAQGNYGAGETYRAQGGYGTEGVYGVSGNYEAAKAYGAQENYGTGDYGAGEAYRPGGADPSYGNYRDDGVEAAYEGQGNYSFRGSDDPRQIYIGEENYGREPAYETERGYQTDSRYIEENSAYGSDEDGTYLVEDRDYEPEGAYEAEQGWAEEEMYGRRMAQQESVRMQKPSGTWNASLPMGRNRGVDEEMMANLHQEAAEQELAAEMSRISASGYREPEYPSGHTKIFGERNAVRPMHYVRKQTAEDMEREKVYHERSYVPHHLMIESKTPEEGFQLAIEILKQIHQENGVNNQVIKIAGSKLSLRGIFNVSDKLAGKDLIIEEAGDLTQKDLEELQMLLERDETGMIVVLIDNPYQMEELHQQNPGFVNLFRCINAGEDEAEVTESWPEELSRETIQEGVQESEVESEVQSETEAEDEGQESRKGEGESEAEEEPESEEYSEEDQEEYMEDESDEETDYEEEYPEDESDEENDYEEEYSEDESEEEADYEEEYSEDGAEEEAGYEEEYPEDESDEYESDDYENDEYEDSGYRDEEYEDGEYEEPYEDDYVDDEELELKEFADYAVDYAKEIDCSITGKSMLALYERIEIMEEDGIPLTRTNAEELIEEAADRAEKPSLGGLIKGVFSSKYDKDGLLILKEEHFI